jgi:excisionase family DNA binding protein
MKLIGYKEIAEMMGMPIGTIYAWVCRKEIPHIRISAKLVRFDLDEIQKWIEEKRVSEEKKK